MICIPIRDCAVTQFFNKFVPRTLLKNEVKFPAAATKGKPVYQATDYQFSQY